MEECPSIKSPDNATYFHKRSEFMIKRLTGFITLFLLVLFLAACHNTANDPKVDGVIVEKLTNASERESFRTISVEENADAVHDTQDFIQDFDFDDDNTDDITPTHQFYLNYDGGASALPKAMVYTLGKTTDGDRVIIGKEANFDNVDVLDEEDSKEIYQLLIGEKLD